MKKDPSISILIPVFNVEKYIERSARSLFDQTYENLECIFVDDCSPDNSIGILENVLKDYPRRKEQVKIIKHECNKGVSAARNTALRNSSGEFTIFVDSDDDMPRDAIEKLVKKQLDTGADIITGQVVGHYDDKVSIIERPHFYDHDDFVEDMIKPSLNHTLWGRLIRKSLYIEHNIQAKEGINIGEDMQIMVQLAFYANRCESLWEVVYYYNCTNELSCMNQYDLDNIHRLTQDTASMEIVRDFFIGKSDKFQNQAEGYLRDYYLRLLRYYGRSKMKDDFEGIQKRLFGLRPQNRQMPKKQKMKFSNYRIFRITESLLK
jgi:glycosyltransferase involved in cell wall biosynthesis